MKNHSLFKSREKIVKIGAQKWEQTEYQCPICKQWFNSWYNHSNTVGVKLHIYRIGKTEIFAKSLGYIKKAPHFEFYKKNTRPADVILKPREWKVLW